MKEWIIAKANNIKDALTRLGGNEILILSVFASIMTILYFVFFLGGISTVVGGALYSIVQFIINNTSIGMISLLLSAALLTYASIPERRPLYKVLAPLAAVLFMIITLPFMIQITPAYGSMVALYVGFSAALGFKYPQVNIYNMLTFAAIVGIFILGTLTAPVAGTSVAIAATSSSAVSSGGAVALSGLAFFMQCVPLLQALFTSATLALAINCIPDVDANSHFSRQIQFIIILALINVQVIAGVMSVFVGPAPMVLAHLISAALLLITIISGDNRNLMANAPFLVFSAIFLSPLTPFVITSQVIAFIAALGFNLYWVATIPDAGVRHEPTIEHHRPRAHRTRHARLADELHNTPGERRGFRRMDSGSSMFDIPLTPDGADAFEPPFGDIEPQAWDTYDLPPTVPANMIDHNGDLRVIPLPPTLEEMEMKFQIDRYESKGFDNSDDEDSLRY